jgi:hypothetical protein
MEISPIAGIRAVIEVKSPKNDPQLFTVFDIENAIGPQHDTFSHNEGKMTGRQDDETTEQESSAEPSIETQATDSGSSVDLFA